MRKAVIYIVFVSLIFPCYHCLSQTTVEISKPYLEVKANTVNIYYNIINSHPTDKFRIWLEITDSTGNVINPNALYGDFGNDVSGGNNKIIKWDLTSDSVFVDTGLFFRIFAEKLPSEKTEDIILPVKKDIKPGIAIFQSLLFPGWGLSAIHKRQPHWIKGITAYGLITTSIIYNRKAISSYDDYLNTSDIQNINRFYDNSVKQDNISEICAYTAIGIWAIDLFWTLNSVSKIKKDKKYSQTKGISINPEYNHSIKTPLLTVRYNF